MTKNAIFVGFPIMALLDNKKSYERIKKAISNDEKAIALSNAVNSYLKVSNNLTTILITWLYPASYILSRKNITGKLKIQSVALYETLNEKLKPNSKTTRMALYSSNGIIEFLSKPKFRNDLAFSENLIHTLLFLLPCIIYGNEEDLLQWAKKFVKRENTISDKRMLKMLNNIERILIEHFDVEMIIFPPLIEDEIEEGIMEINKEIEKMMKKHGYDISTI